MNKAIKKIGVILVFLILLPIIFFLTIEISNLNKSEEVIEEIYKNQLEFILYSLNQYSEDLANSWKSRINIIAREASPNNNLSSNLFSKLLSENKAIKYIFIADSSRFKDAGIFSLNEKLYHEPIRESIRKNINKIFNENKKLFIKISRLKSHGFVKIVPIILNKDENTSSLIFLLDNNDLCGIVIDPNQFIRNNLSPKIQEVSKQKFIIAAIEDSTNNIAYSTEEFRTTDETQKSHLWLLPQYSIAIQMKGRTIAGLVRERAYTNLILLIILTMALFAGMWFVYRNVKKELELVQIKSDFISNVSHELRTPLSLISMYAETLELDRLKTDEKKKEYYEVISHEARRLSGIVNSILNFSKMEAGKREYNFSTVNLNTLIIKVIETYKHQLNSNGFKYTLALEEKLPNAFVDKEAVSEAVINLLDNAIKYSREVKELNIISGFDEEKIFIEIADKGVGITESNQKKIFEKFYRIQEGLVHDAKGTGLGLTLVKHIMDAHKGKVILNSSPGKGSAFKLCFPLRKQKKIKADKG